MLPSVEKPVAVGSTRYVEEPSRHADRPMLRGHETLGGLASRATYARVRHQRTDTEASSAYLTPPEYAEEHKASTLNHSPDHIPRRKAGRGELRLEFGPQQGSITAEAIRGHFSQTGVASSTPCTSSDYFANYGDGPARSSLPGTSSPFQERLHTSYLSKRGMTGQGRCSCAVEVQEKRRQAQSMRNSEQSQETLQPSVIQDQVQARRQPRSNQDGPARAVSGQRTSEGLLNQKRSSRGSDVSGQLDLASARNMRRQLRAELQSVLAKRGHA